jgi:ankyrin repeat protein
VHCLYAAFYIFVITLLNCLADGNENGGSVETLHTVVFESADKEGWTPLHHAVFRGDEKTFSELLSLQVTTTVRDTLGRTSLHITAYYGYDTLVKILLHKGADKGAEKGCQG